MSNLGLKNDQAQDATTTREAPSRQELAQFAAAAVLTSVCVAAVARFLFIVLVLFGLPLVPRTLRRASATIALIVLLAVTLWVGRSIARKLRSRAVFFGIAAGCWALLCLYLQYERPW